MESQTDRPSSAASAGVKSIQSIMEQTFSNNDRVSSSGLFQSRMNNISIAGESTNTDYNLYACSCHQLLYHSDQEFICMACQERKPEEHLIESDNRLSLENGLIYTSNQRLKVKDFSSEVRASMDVEQFVHQAELMLDMRKVSVEHIVDSMLERVAQNERVPASKLDEAKRALFVPGSAMMLTQTIQGMSFVFESGHSTCVSSVHHDQSWLCAFCSLAQINRRHMVVARFRQPTKMAINANCVRLFALIVTPSNEKGTKTALETGRTFSTMLMDINFRQRLLESETELEFRSLMMLKAQQLSKNKLPLKNRHKYNLGVTIQLSMNELNLDSQADHFSISPASPRLCIKESHQDPSADQANVETDENQNVVDCNPDENRKLERSRRLLDKNPQLEKLFELIARATDNELPEQNGLANQHVDRVKESDGPKLSRDKGNNNHNGHNSNLLCTHLQIGRGLWQDFTQRIRFYPDDFIDAFIGPPKTIQKTVATIWFLYFSILLPTIAFSALNTTQTIGHMGDLRKAIIGQAVGGLAFALLGGQPLVIIMTTAPLCLYTKVIHQMCMDYGFHFPAMYAAVGIFNGFFLMIYSLFGFSSLMKWCTRSSEEIFALFIVVAFVTDACKDLMKNLDKYYFSPACRALNETGLIPSMASSQNTSVSILNSSGLSGDIQLIDPAICRRDTSLLFILLMLGTRSYTGTLKNPFSLASNNPLSLQQNLTPFYSLLLASSPYLGASKRELLADYALPTAVIVMSFVGSFVFDDIYVEKFPPLKEIRFERAQLEILSWTGLLTAMGLGFTLSLLFFMDQNISAAMVNAPQNGLKKGCAYHFDLLVVGLLNGFLALYGFPMMHGVLPHSPLHVRCLADIEERVEDGHLREIIVNVRETRVTAIISHVLVLASIFLIPYPIAYIPTAVLNGLFLYMAITSLDGLQIFERILLIFTEQTKYPPNHYIRRCPQRKIHQFTVLQLLQLTIMCVFGFSPFNIMEMFFPAIIFLMIPFRLKIVPTYIDEKFLEALDGKHS